MTSKEKLYLGGHMDKKIFISHSSLDTEIGEKFVDLLIEIGIPKEIIFFHHDIILEWKSDMIFTKK